MSAPEQCGDAAYSIRTDRVSGWAPAASRHERLVRVRCSCIAGLDIARELHGSSVDAADQRRQMRHEHQSRRASAIKSIPARSQDDDDARAPSPWGIASANSVHLRLATGAARRTRIGDQVLEVGATAFERQKSEAAPPSGNNRGWPVRARDLCVDLGNPYRLRDYFGTRVLGHAHCSTRRCP
jgi:hypothetical protein